MEILGKSFGRKEHAWPSSSEGASWENCNHLSIHMFFKVSALPSMLRWLLILLLLAEISGDSGYWSQEVVKWKRRKSACIAFNLAICRCSYAEILK